MNNSTTLEGTSPSQSGPIPNWKKNIVLFLASQAVSLFGSSLVQYAITWYITLKTQSGVMMTTSIICGFLPAFLVSPFAGVWADRYNRKILIMAADSFIAVSTLILALLFLAGYNAIWLLFVVSAVRSIGSGIQTPAIGGDGAVVWDSRPPLSRECARRPSPINADI